MRVMQRLSDRLGGNAARGPKGRKQEWERGETGRAYRVIVYDKAHNPHWKGNVAAMPPP